MLRRTKKNYKTYNRVWPL